MSCGRGLAVVWLVVLALPASAAQLRLGSVLGDGGAEGFARAEEVRPFEFPADHGPHPRFRSEWWYLTASLETPDGAAYGVQFTVFRQALRPQPVFTGPWDASQLYLAHLALTDVAAGSHRQAERLSRGHPRLAGAVAAPFRAWVDGWSLSSADGWSLSSADEGLAALSLQAATAAFAVDLRLQALKPVVLQGNRGLSAKGPGQASYYYTLPRLAVSGEVRSEGHTVPVSGSAWLDREWSTSVLSDDQQGWDWFALQFDSGEELMVFQLRRESGLRDPYDQGLWVAADGTSHQLRTQDFRLEPRRYWQDADGAAWPVAWQLQVMGPEGPRQLRVEAAVDDQRMETLLIYWEGLVRVFDETGARIGTGYMELTGHE